MLQEKIDEFEYIKLVGGAFILPSGSGTKIYFLGVGVGGDSFIYILLLHLDI